MPESFGVVSAGYPRFLLVGPTGVLQGVSNLLLLHARDAVIQ